MCKHEKTDECLSKCPQCGGGADNGLDRCIPQSAYMCKKCCEIEVEERAAVDATHNARSEARPACGTSRSTEELDRNLTGQEDEETEIA